MINPAKKLLGDFIGKAGIVLVIEPSINYRISLKQFLTNLKVKNLKLVSSVADARREMLTNKISLFIVEWGLDEINGLQFCRALRREAAYRDTPFLLLSTENLRKDVMLATEVHIDGYLLKPFSYEDFCAQLVTIIGARSQPSALTTMLDFADELLVRGDLDGAGQTYAEALALRETSARAMCGQAQVVRRRGDRMAALRLLERAAEVNPDYIEAHRKMLEIFEELGDRGGTIQAASVLNSLSPENPRYTLVLAGVYLEMKNFEVSETFFKRTLALSPRLAEAYKGLGNVYMATEEYELAMKSYRKALDLDQDDISTLNSLGTAYVRMGHYKEGLDKYMIALKLDPHDSRVLFNVAHAHEKRGDLTKARKFYAQSLAQKPGYDKAVRGLERVDKMARDGTPGVLAADEPDDIVLDGHIKLTV